MPKKKKLPEGFAPEPVDDPTFVHEEATEWPRCKNCNSQSTDLNDDDLCPFCAEA